MTTAIIGGITALLFGLAIRSIIRSKKNGTSCGCENCAGACHPTKSKE